MTPPSLLNTTRAKAALALWLSLAALIGLVATLVLFRRARVQVGEPTPS